MSNSPLFPPRGGKDSRSPLWRMAGKYKGTMLTMAAASFIGALLEAAFLVLVTAIGMTLVTQASEVGPVLGVTLPMASALGLGAGLLIFRLLFSVSGVHLAARLTARVGLDQRRILTHAFLGTSWAVQQEEPSGRLQELLTSFVSRLINAVTTLTTAITALLSLVAFLGAALVVDFLSTLAVAVALAVVGSILIPFRQAIRKRARSSSQAGLAFANAVAELGSLGLEMQTYGVKERFTDTIDRLAEENTELQRRVNILTGTLSPLYMTLAYAAVLGGIAVLSVLGSADLAVIGAVMLLMLRLLAYGQQLATAAGSLASSAPFLDRLREEVDRYNTDSSTSGRIRPEQATPFKAEGVQFAYVADRPALSDATFEIATGEIVGIVGPSGAGKSTLAQLLIGLRPPDGGVLLAGGAPISNIERAWWNRQVAFVAQDAKLVTGTVAENIRFFRDGIDDVTMRRAAKQANILDDIEALPHGFDTHLGERGGQLSGGQRQRLSIARALAGKPDVLVLDEPTSALDGRSESLIRDTLGQLRGHVTVAIIAHRMSTLDICDRIMVVENGTITGFAAPRDLRETNRFFRMALAASGMTP